MALLEVGQYLGCVERQAAPSVGLITETSYAAGAAIREHAHQRPYLAVVVDGTCLERTDGGERECGAGTLVYHPRGAPHELSFGADGGRCVNVELSPEWLERSSCALPSDDGSRYARRPTDPWLSARLREELRSPDACTDMAMAGIVLELIVTLIRVPGASATYSTPSWMRCALAHLDHRSTPPSLEELAAECGVHPSHLARTFRRHEGVTVGEYSRRARLRRACRELASSDEPIARIALATGFADQSHLTRVMRRLMGITPAEYRRRS